MREEARKQEDSTIFSIFFTSCLLVSLFLLPGERHVLSWTLALTGDVMLGRGVAQSLGENWEIAFAEVHPWLSDADVTFANLESPLTTAPQSAAGYDLRAPPEAVAALQAAGFDVVSLANNHALDAGQAGLRETMDTLAAAGIVGLADWSPTYRFAKVPTCHVIAFDDSVTLLDLGAAAEAVTAAAERAALVVVSIHWGGEYQVAPGPRQQSLAEALVAAGADIIVGHGPHVLQRVEWVGKSLVAYSLGNFLFDQPYPADCRQGAILSVTVQDHHIVAVTAMPTVVEHERVRAADPQEGAAILTRLALESADIRH